MPYNHMYYRHRVAPRVGAWIETPRSAWPPCRPASLPVWERGLKLIKESSYLLRSGRSPCGSVD